MIIKYYDKLQNALEIINFSLKRNLLNNATNVSFVMKFHDYFIFSILYVMAFGAGHNVSLISVSLAPTCQPNRASFDSKLRPRLLLHLDLCVCVI